MKNVASIFGGAGLGILIGILIGMSTSGVVGVIIGAISSILLVLLGLKEDSDTIHKALRVGSFGFFCSAAILFGLYFRTNDSFSPSVKTEIEKWTANNVYSIDEAKKYVLYEKFGFMPKGVTIDSSKNTDRRLTELFGNEIKISDCERVVGYESFPIENEIKSYQELGGTWKNIAEYVSLNIEPQKQKETIHTLRKCLCNE